MTVLLLEIKLELVVEELKVNEFTGDGCFSALFKRCLPKTIMNSVPNLTFFSFFLSDTVEGSLDSADKPSIQARFYNCSFESNYSPVGGGGIHGTAASTASFRNSTFYNNNSTLGGALFLSQVSEFQLYGCTCDSNV